MSRDTSQCSRASQSSGVISGRMRYHSSSCLLFIQASHRIAGASRLECSDVLEVFTLKEKFSTAFHIDQWSANDWRFDDLIRDPRGSCLNSRQIDCKVVKHSGTHAWQSGDSYFRHTNC
mgnify:CR=1 FL=1